MAPRLRVCALLLVLVTTLTACVNRTAATDTDGAGHTGHPVTTTETQATETETETETVTDTPTTTADPLEPAAIDRVFQVYMNGLANHDMIALKSATCPELRDTLLGFALHGYFVARWEMLPYSIPPDVDFVTVQATVTQSDPNTGANAGDVVYSWYVQRAADRSYYVCGWLDYE